MNLFMLGTRSNRLAMLIGTGLGLTLSAMAIAQSDQDSGSSADSLKLPTELTVFGAHDPHVHKATAIVNGTIVTDTDIDQRLALVQVANGGRIKGDELERVRLQVLRNLIDETLQIQAAKAKDIEITSDEIDQTFTRIAGNFKRSPKDFATYLHEVGSSAASMKRQIEGEMAWRRLLSRQVEPFVSVGEEEVRAVMARLNSEKGATEFHIGEIYLSGTPATSNTQSSRSGSTSK